MTLETRYRIPPTVMLQVVDDETLLYDSATGLFFSLNDVGATIWEVMNDYETLQGVLSELMEIFEVDRDQLEGDVFAFVTMLAEQNLVQVDV